MIQTRMMAVRGNMIHQWATLLRAERHERSMTSTKMSPDAAALDMPYSSFIVMWAQVGLLTVMQAATAVNSTALSVIDHVPDYEGIACAYKTFAAARDIRLTLMAKCELTRRTFVDGVVEGDLRQLPRYGVGARPRVPHLAHLFGNVIVSINAVTGCYSRARMLQALSASGNEQRPGIHKKTSTAPRRGGNTSTIPTGHSCREGTCTSISGDPVTSSSSSSSETLSKRPSDPSMQMSPGMTCAQANVGFR